MATPSRSAAWTRRVMAVILGLTPALMVLGCGGETEQGLTGVSGRVTLDGGAWPGPGQIIFSPTLAGRDPKAPVVSYVAPFGTDGSFTVAHPGANGMKPGRYGVSVDCPLGEVVMPVNPGDKVEVKNAAPKIYRNPESSGLKLVVEDGTSPTATFDVKSK